MAASRPNVFFSDIMAEDDAFLNKAIEGFVLFALNQGEVCTCPSRALIQKEIPDAFIARCIERVKAIKQGDPRHGDHGRRPGQPRAAGQDHVLPDHRHAGRRRDAGRRRGGKASGFYIQPAILKGHNKMRVFQEEIFGPVVSVTTFNEEAEALALANDTMYGLGAGVWSRDANRCFRHGPRDRGGPCLGQQLPRYPAHAAFGATSSRGSGARRTR